MIVEVGFFDHWKTQQVIDALDDRAAPIYIQRLWAHCQQSKRWQFPNISQGALKAICRYPREAELLDSALLEAGFIRRDGNIMTVHNWEIYNASLVSAWSNGRKGGRPPQTKTITPAASVEPTDIPQETHGLPTDIPSCNRGEGIGLDENGTDKNRSDKTGESAPLSAPRDLMEFIEEFNSQFAGIFPSMVADSATIKRWDLVQRDPEAREAFADIVTLMEKLRIKSAVLKTWLDSDWLLGKDRNGIEWNVKKILSEKKYLEKFKSGQKREIDLGAGQVYDPSTYS